MPRKGLGCDACRQQHKKCDLAQPTCSRCRRLRISCDGSGQTRYQFRFDSRSSAPEQTPRSLEQVVAGFSTSLVHTPDNDTTRLQRALIARLRPALDPRYSILIRWGYFLVGAPRRLGSNKALDAAVNALLARHTELSLRQSSSSIERPVALYYSKALSALRGTLQHEQTATSTETLFAVILLMYCQTRDDDQFTFFCSPHGNGIAQLLRMRGFPSGENYFENSIFATLYATLILQSFANPEVELSSREYELVDEGYTAAFEALGSDETAHFLLLSQVSRLRIRVGSSQTSQPQYNLVTEAERLKARANSVLAELRSDYEASLISCGTTAHAIAQRALGLAMGTKALLMCVMRALLLQSPELDAEVADLSKDVLSIVEDARIYRPLCPVWTVHTLLCIWCAVDESTQREKIEAALLDYQRDANGPSFQLQTDQLITLRQRLRLQE